MPLPRLLPRLLLVSMLLFAGAAAAEVVTDTGSAGAAGAAGAPGNPGDDGAAGEDASASAGDTDPQNDATATGGRGGDGGDGGTGADGGNGGDGGDATADASSVGSGTPRSNATANGGDGGDGGAGGAADATGTSGSGGDGGDGGDAAANANAVSDSGGAFPTARANGGDGGDASGATAFAGDGGAAAATASASATTTSNAIVHATGGDGGNAAHGATAGAGGAATSIVTETSSETGEFRTDQRATGGAGGDVDGSGTAGSGGSASVRATVSRPAGMDLRLRATGGAGGSVNSGVGSGGDGGDATSFVHGVGAAPPFRSVMANATSHGGIGGTARGVGERGGDGGSAAVSVRAETSTEAAFAGATAVGGIGGQGLDGADGGDGGDVALVDTATATGPEIVVFQEAVGGNGGFTSAGTAPSVGTPGKGGDASSTLRADNPNGSLRVTSNAEGGWAGGNASTGGDAHAAAVGTASGEVHVWATANGGRDAFGSGDVGADGSRATLGAVQGVSTGGGDVFVRGSATAGRASRGVTQGGAGAEMTLIDVVDGDTAGALDLRQTAIAGSGGDASAGTGGAGGDALSSLTRTKQAASLLADVRAGGGSSGESTAGAAPVTGGSATSHADVRNDGGSVRLAYSAGGGGGSDGADFLAPLDGGTGGDAHADAKAVTSGDGNAVTVGNPVRGPSPDSWSIGGSGGESRTRGGDGGDADTRAEGVALGDSTVDAYAIAFGGSGGRTQGIQAGAVGGDGGDADARALGSNAGASKVLAEARATGGSGGLGRTSFGQTGGRGGTATATAHATSSGGGDATAIALATGGQGADGGDAGDVVQRDAVSGRTSGVLRLVQEARGGGAGSDPSVDGRGGSASSHLDYVDDVAQRVEAQVIAIAGSGSTLGDADAGASVSAVGEVDVLARAQGARGLGSNGVTTVGPVFGRSTGGQQVRVAAEVLAGSGGDGADAIIDSAVDGQTGGVLDLVQTAVGGDAFTALSQGSLRAGVAGSATNRLERFRAAGELNAHVTATGGAGASESHPQRPATAGGAATSDAEVVNPTGSASAFVHAQGGTGGRGRSGSVAGDGGDAVVTARARSYADGADVVVGGANPSGLSFGAQGGDTGAGSGSTRGDGGHASSSSFGVADGSSRVRVHDRAVGGNGVQAGNADSHAEGQNAGSQAVDVLAEAIGGDSIYFGGVGGTGSASARGTSRSGDVNVVARQSNGQQLGTGLDSTMVDAVSGSTEGLLTLHQNAIAGDGLGLADEDGGAADSSLTASNEGGGALVLVSEATAGDGGGGTGNGGSATASARGIGTGDARVDVNATARGGSGAAANIFRTDPAGDGGAAMLGFVHGTSSGGGDVRVRGEAIGGVGGTVGGGPGAGADVTLIDAVDASTSGAILLEQSAIAGSGTQAGSAWSELDFSTLAAALTVQVHAQGGGSLSSFDSATPGNGGVAIARAENLGGAAAAFAHAQGSGSRQIGADARAEAFARTAGDAHDVLVGHAFTSNGPTTHGAFGGNGIDSDGGDASSRSEGLADGDGAVQVFDVAVGGRADTGFTGGSATSFATGRAAGARSVSVQSEAIGGDSDFNSAGPGGSASASASGFSDGGGDVDVVAIQRGGGGNSGAASHMLDAVSGATSGRLSLAQRAEGGNGFRGGAAGAASSHLQATNALGGDLDVLSEAIGGDHGQGSATADADASASAQATGTAAATVVARAVGGSGGGGGADGGAGGRATLGSVTGISGSGEVHVTGEATGGRGGAGFTTASDGASVDLDDVVSGSTTGRLTLVQRATGGDAGGNFGRAGGGAGSASSRIDEHASSSHLGVVNEAFGGDGARGARSGLADGADASSAVDAINDAGSIDVVATALGGDASTQSTLVARGGDATLALRAETLGNGQDIRIGKPPPTQLGEPLTGAFGGAGGRSSGAAGGGGDATSVSEAIAHGNSRVEVYDRAGGGSGRAGFGVEQVGGGANSRAFASTAGARLAAAHSLATGGSVFGSPTSSTRDVFSEAEAHGLGEVQATAAALLGLGSTIDGTTLARALGSGSSGLVSAEALGAASPATGPALGLSAYAESEVLAAADAVASTIGTGPLPGSALSSPESAGAFIAGGGRSPGEWGRGALILSDLQPRDESPDHRLRSEVGFSAFGAADVLFVSFLSLEFEEDGFDELTFRVENAGVLILEQVFSEAQAVVDFFSGVLEFANLQTVDMRIALELASAEAGTRVGTLFAFGTAPVPEPQTGLLVSFGLVAMAARKRRRSN